ncbi:HAD family hydrolase [Streptomyces sp. LN549]|uniref:HAD family hydrolase n=1 Tax=Streptomyces sp. LN549 TaxID=3112979 RepID=UPI00371FAB3F
MTDPQPRELQALFASAKCVYFDFDGPVCNLFSGHTSTRIAALLAGELVAAGSDPGLAGGPACESDPLAILKAVADAGPNRELVARLESRLTQEEVTAAGSADPTEDADRLIRTLHRLGYGLAVTTNNSPEAVARYLGRRGTAHLFGGRVHGRVPGNPWLLKPHPDCLVRALESTGTAAADALMIGDSRADLLAADALGMPFIGYARNDDKRRALGAGPGVVVRQLTTLAHALDVASAEQG